MGLAMGVAASLKVRGAEVLGYLFLLMAGGLSGFGFARGALSLPVLGVLLMVNGAFAWRQGRTASWQPGLSALFVSGLWVGVAWLAQGAWAS